MKYLFLAPLLLLAGCDYKTKTESKQLNTGSDGGRMRIIESQAFTDAAGYTRNILILKDTKTDQEFLAVGGCGVMSFRQQGKVVVEQ